MSYVRAFIATCEAFGWTGGPGFNTDIQQLRSGRESRNADWQQVQHFYSVPFQSIDRSEYAPVKRMHMVCMGRLHCFLYRDQLDYTASDEIFAVAAPGQTVFQLSKTSTLDDVSYQRNVYALYAPGAGGEAIEVAPEITVDGVAATGVTVDPERGLVTFDSPMTGGELLRWSGEFAVWVRFDNDRLPFSITDNSDGEFVVDGSVELLEMFPPLPEVGS